MTGFHPLLLDHFHIFSKKIVVTQYTTNTPLINLNFIMKCINWTSSDVVSIIFFPVRHSLNKMFSVDWNDRGENTHTESHIFLYNFIIIHILRTDFFQNLYNIGSRILGCIRTKKNTLCNDLTRKKSFWLHHSELTETELRQILNFNPVSN